MSRTLSLVVLAALLVPLRGHAEERLPIIDMHLHAYAEAQWQGRRSATHNATLVDSPAWNETPRVLREAPIPPETERARAA